MRQSFFEWESEYSSCKNYGSRTVVHPSFNFDRNSSKEKLNIWAGTCGDGSLLGLFFFEGNIDGGAYLVMINKYYIVSALLTRALAQAAAHANGKGKVMAGIRAILEKYYCSSS